MAAVFRALPQLCSFFYLIVIYSTLFCIVPSGKASPIITYDREQLLSIGLTVKNTFSPPPTTNKGEFPWRCLPAIPGTWRRRRKQGSRAGVLVRLRKRENRPPLPSILLANVQSLDNKLDELHSRMAFQQDIKFCNVMVFTETWLDSSIPDSAIVPEGISLHRQHRTINSGKSKGGGVCFMVNNLWCSDVEIISSGCSPDLEHLMIRCRPYYIPREFTSVVITAVYIPPNADTNQALDDLHAVIDRTETSRPEAAFIVAGDFNNAKMRKVLSRYYQHISCPTRGKNTLDHVYTPIRGAYKALPCPPFGKSDHVSVLLLPSYRQKLKRDRPVTRTIQRWSDQSDSGLQDCFSTREWCVFQDDDINTDTDICYISKCIDDVVPRISVRTFPNQKPWINCDVHAKLKARTVAYISGDLEEYRKSRYRWQMAALK